MSAPNIRDPFGTFFLACIKDYRSVVNGAAISDKIWSEKFTEWHAAWTLFRQPKRKKRGGTLTDEEWVASLKVDPFLEGVDIDKEIAKCQFHFRNLPHPIIPSRKRLANWLKNADKTYAPKKSAAESDPVGWLEWMRVNRPDWRRFKEEAEGHPVPAWNHLPKDERAYIMAEMKKAL